MGYTVVNPDAYTITTTSQILEFTALYLWYQKVIEVLE